MAFPHQLEQSNAEWRTDCPLIERDAAIELKTKVSFVACIICGDLGYLYRVLDK